MFIYEIIHQVHEAFKGLPDKLAEKTRKNRIWWYSHGYEPKSMNPMANGNPSPADHFVDFVETYESGAKGAGLMLADKVHAEIHLRYGATVENTSQQCIRRDLLKEGSEACLKLDGCDLKDISINELKEIEVEVDDILSASMNAKSYIRATIRMKEMEKAQQFTAASSANGKH